MVSRGWLGLAWTLTSVTAALGGSPWLAAWLAVCAAAAAAQLAVSARREARRSVLAAVAAVVAGGLALAGLAGANRLGPAVGVALLVILLGRAGGKTPMLAAEATRVLSGATATGVAMASLVVLCGRSPEALMFLLACVAAYDTGAYLIGTGASSWWEGTAAGMAAVIPVTLLASALGAFPGTGPAIQLGVVAAGLAPVGPLAARAMLGPGVPEWRAPTLRRLDSLLVLSPVWVNFALRFLGPTGPSPGA